MPSEIGLSMFWTSDPQSILQHTLDFSSGTKVDLSNDFIPGEYRLLEPDPSPGGSRSSSLLDDRGTSIYDESSTTSSSPASYTKEFTNVSSPLTPLSDARRSKSKSPSQLTFYNGSRFLADDEDSPLRKPQQSSPETSTGLANKSTEDVRAIDETQPSTSQPSPAKTVSVAPYVVPVSPVKEPERKNKISPFSNTVTSMKPRTMTIKIGQELIGRKPLVNGSPIKKPLVDYGSDESTEDDDTESKKSKKEDHTERCPSPRTIIGPLKPSKLPITKPEPLKPTKRNGDAATSSPATKRKRLLSERGEKESAYPVMDKSTVSAWNWSGCNAVVGRSRGSGLHNNSNDCFLNAILQMVTHTAPLCRYIIERHPHEKCSRPSGQCIACSMYASHLKRSLQSAAPFAASWIRPHLRRIFPSHMHGMQEDAHELLALFLDAIDPPISSLKAQNQGTPNGLIPPKPSTPVEQIFGGTLRNQVTCNNCGQVHTNYERIRELNLAIKRRPDSDCSKIAYLIENYFKDENLSSFDCKKCERKTAATRRTRILRPPAVLLVQLKRFNAFGGKIRLPVTADMDVDLSRFMQDGAPGPSFSSQYVLTSVVEHLGAGVDHGHYVAYCRGFDHKQWFHFDDECVSGISGQKVVSSQPYLLVYSRREDLNLAPMKAVEGTAFQKTTFNGQQRKSNGFVQKGNHFRNGNGANRSYNGYQNGINNKMKSVPYKLI